MNQITVVVTVLPCILLLLYINNVSALAALGATCKATADCETTVTGTICDTTIASPKCAIGVDGICSASGNTDKCVNGAGCTGSTNTLCECATADYVADTTNKICKAKLGKTCIASAYCDTTTITTAVCDTTLAAAICKIGAGGVCTGNIDKCISPATCTGSTNTKCECPAGYTATTDNKCSGAVTLVVSGLMVLLTLVTMLI